MWFINKTVFVFWKIVSGKSLSKLSCVCLPLEKLVNGKYFQVNGKHFPIKGKFGFVFRKVFSFYFGRKILSGSCEKFRNIILFADYIKFGPIFFYNCYLLFPYYFLIEIFYLSNLVLIVLIVTYFIWNNLWNVNYYYFNFFIFQFFYFLNLISIILIIIYFIWDNLWNYIFFNFIFIQLFNL
jgi:hypothetical protein